MKTTKSIILDRGWQIVLKDLKISPENVLKRAKLPATLIIENDMPLSVDEYYNFWDSIEAEASTIQNLPIKFANSLSTEAFSPPIFAALCSENFEKAVDRISHYKKLISPARIVFSIEDNNFKLTIIWPPSESPIPQILAVTELTFFVKLIQMGTRELIKPKKVECQYLLGPIQEYIDFFGVEPNQGSSSTLTFKLADVRKPFLTANENMWSSFEKELRKKLSELESKSTVIEKIECLLLEYIPAGDANIDRVSRSMGLSPRGLQRQLKKEGTTFQHILKEVRKALAIHYLKNTKLNYSEISFLLGFDEQGSFFRAFKKYTGKTPENIRGKN